jgi:hypothetical protein
MFNIQKIRKPEMLVTITAKDMDEALRRKLKAIGEMKPYSICENCAASIALDRAFRAKFRRHNLGVMSSKGGIELFKFSDHRTPVQKYDRPPLFFRKFIADFDCWTHKKSAGIDAKQPDPIRFRINLKTGQFVVGEHGPAFDPFPQPKKGQVWRREERKTDRSEWVPVKNDLWGEVVVVSDQTVQGFIQTRSAEASGITGGWYPDRFKERGIRENPPYPSYLRSRFVFTGRTQS